MNKFEAVVQPQVDDLVLDVGGYPGTWTERPQRTRRIDCLNIHPVNWDSEAAPDHQITTATGDGCALEFGEDDYDILFSNSVIEHVGDWENQRRFAGEARRVGKKLWIQTPAFACPLEPHYLAPFVHWLPVRIRRRLLRWFTPWGWMTKPSQEKVDETIAFTRLLRRKQIEQLFPDCTIFTERMLGIIPKSYVAYRVDEPGTTTSAPTARTRSSG